MESEQGGGEGRRVSREESEQGGGEGRRRGEESEQGGEKRR